jgi:hypothetical protein
MPDRSHEVHARRIELAVLPGTVGPAEYHDSVDRIYERDFTTAGNPTGVCRWCKQPRYRHRWMLFDGDILIGCSERPKP